MKKLLIFLILTTMVFGIVPIAVAEKIWDVGFAEFANITDEDTDPRSNTDLLGAAADGTYFATMVPQTIIYEWVDRDITFNTLDFIANYALDQGPLTISAEVTSDNKYWTKIVDNRYIPWNAGTTDPQLASISFTQAKNVKKLKVKVETAGTTWGHYIMKVGIRNISDEDVFKQNFDSLTEDSINQYQKVAVDEINRRHFLPGDMNPLYLPKKTDAGVEIIWSCYPDVLDLDTGKLKIEPTDNLKLTLTATLKYGKMTGTKKFFHWYRVPINHALTAKLTASSQRPDGPVERGVLSMSYNGWVANERLPWLLMEWDKPVKVAQVVLSDMPNVEWENIEESYIEFSDGTTVNVGKLPEDGISKDVNFDTPKMITWLKFVVTKNGGGGAYGGLQNIAVLDRIASDFDKPVIYPQATEVTGVENPKISLNGIWKFTMDIPDKFWEEGTDTSIWSDIPVPSELEFRGFHTMSVGKEKYWGLNPEFLPGEDIEYPYETKFMVPKDYEGKRVFLNFRATFTYARIWIDGKYVGDHEGGFTTWDLDVTDFVTPGKEARMTVGLTARKEFIEYRHARGILGDVFLFCLPSVTMDKFQFDPILDSKLENANLKIRSRINFHEGDKAKAVLKLIAPDGRDVPITPNVIEYDKQSPYKEINIPVNKPLKWDTERPNLYKLNVILERDGVVLSSFTKNIGFRDVKVKGSKIYINGVDAKFTGGNLLRATADNGDAVPIEDIKNMLLAMKNANYNYVRTAHYPFPTEALDYCDEIGLFVESETSNTFVAGGVNAPGSQWDPGFTKRYMNPLFEMLERDGNHPSIIIWSVGNESFWGTHFKRSQDYIHENDLQTRPVLFSWADSRSDILGRHYDAPLDNNDKPVIFQEIHWTLGFGESLDPSSGVDYPWVIREDLDQIRKSKSESGLVVWNFLDMKPEGLNTNGGGVSGIYDSWLRPKPEYYPMRKMQSPIIFDETKPLVEKNGKINLEVENWFNFTNLKDIKFEYQVGDEKGEFYGNDIKPQSSGILSLPARNWKLGDAIHIKALEKSYGIEAEEYRCLDEWELIVGNKIFNYKQAPKEAPKVSETPDSVVIYNDNFRLDFSKNNGLISEGSFKGEKVITGGPYMNFGGNKAIHWVFGSMNYTVLSDSVVLHIKGVSAGVYDTIFNITVDNDGRIKTNYTIYYTGGKPVDVERECGVVYDLVPKTETLQWIRRDNNISWYPEYEILRLEGSANKTPENLRAWGEKPQVEWKDDVSYNATLSSSKELPYDKSLGLPNDFRSSKYNIYFAALKLKGSETGLRVESDGNDTVRCRLSPDNESVRMLVNNKWSFTGYTYQDVFYLPNGYTNSVTVRLSDSDDYSISYENELKTKSDGIVNHTKSAKVSASSVSGAWCVPHHGADGNRETQWVSKGELTPWFLLEWDKEVEIDVVKLFNRNNKVDLIKKSYIEFSDGTRIDVGELPSDGSMKMIKLEQTKKTKSAKFVVTEGAGSNVGLREIECLAVPKKNIIPR